MSLHSLGKTLHTPALPRPAAIMRNRSDVTDRRDGKTCRLQRAQRRFPARSGTRYLDFEGAHAVFLRLLGGIFGSDLSRVGCGFAGAFEAHGAGRRPGDRIALGVGDGNHRIVEARIHMRDAGGDVLAFASTDAGGFLSHTLSPFAARSRDRLQTGRWTPGRETYFFFPAIAFAGPLRVRALVWVRWPRTGRPRRCRNPR